MSLAEQPVVNARNPFPGLRPYGTKDADFFFGREDQIHELLTRLRSARFLAVLGESGCGKSSLIRAGLLPPLIDGFMTSKGSEWRLAVMRPGAHPMDRLAQALAKPEALGIDESDPDTAMGFLQATLLGGSFGLIEAVQDASLSEGTRLLVLVDQFEELFRFSEDEDHDGLTEEGKSFIKLLIEASIHDVPIYVVITMRSEYLGACSLCPGLPDAINRGLYLVPRPTRDQLRDAIQEPVKLSNGEITQRLTNKLLNDLGSESDQLPILQHVMMRLWSDAYGGSNNQVMDIDRYQEIGGLSNALSLHIEEIFDKELDVRQREIAEVAFRNLTEMTDKAWVIRHPVRLSYIAAAAGAEVPTVAEVLDKFRDEGRNFLMPPISDEKHLSADSTIDISHESLIRQWRQLRKWTREESSDRRVRRMLCEEASKWDKSGRGKEDVLAGVKLAEALEWQQRHTGEINHPNLKVEREYLEASTSRRDEKVRLEEKAKHSETLSRNNRRLTVGSIIAVVLALMAIVAWRSANSRESEAKSALTLAIARESEASLEMRKAHALRLASEAKDETGRPQLRLLLALEAINQSDKEVRAANQFFDALKIFEPSGIRCQALSRHQGAISAMSVGPNQENGNAKWLATGGTDGVIFLWDLEELADNSQVPATPVKTLLGHATAITAMDISPNGKWFASGSEDGERFCWPLETKDESPPPVRLDSESRAISKIKFSPGNYWLGSSSGQNTLTIWSMSEEGPLPNKESENTIVPAPVGISDFHFGNKVENVSDTCPLVTIGTDLTVQLWSLSRDANEDPPYRIEKIEPPQDLETINDAVEVEHGLWMATTRINGLVRLWEMNLETGQVSKAKQLIHPGGSTVVALDRSDRHPDSNNEESKQESKWLATSGNDGVIRFWNYVDPNVGDRFPIELNKSLGVSALAFSESGKWFASANLIGEIHLYRVTPSGPAKTPIILNTHEGAISNICFYERQSPEQSFLVSAGDDSTIRLWKLPTNDEFIERSFEHAFFSNDAKWIVTKRVTDSGITVTPHHLSPATISGSKLSKSESARDQYKEDFFSTILKRAPREKALREGPEQYVKVCMSPTNYIACGDHLGKVVVKKAVRKKLETASEWKPIAELKFDEWSVVEGQIKRTPSKITGLALSPEEIPRWLALLTGSDKVKLCRIGRSDTPQEIDFVGDDRGVIFSPSPSAWLAIWSSKQVKVLDLPDGDDSTTAKNRWREWNSENDDATSIPIQQVKFGPKAKYLAAIRGNEIVLWSFDENQSLKNPILLRGHTDTITSYTFDEDEKWLVTASLDKTIRLWNLSEQKPTEVKQLVTHQEPIQLVCLSNDQTWLATADDKDTVLLWNFNDVVDLKAQTRPVNFHFGTKVGALAFEEDSLLVLNVDGSLWQRKLEGRSLEQLVELARNSVGRYLTSDEYKDIWPEPYGTLYATISDKQKLLPPPHYSALDAIVQRIEGDQEIDTTKAISDIADLFVRCNDPNARKKAEWVVNNKRGKALAESTAIADLATAAGEAVEHFEKITGDVLHSKQIVGGLLKRRADLLVKGGEGWKQAETTLKIANQIRGIESSSGLEMLVQIKAEIQLDDAKNAFNKGKFEDAISHFGERTKLIKENKLEFGTNDAEELRGHGDSIIQLYDVAQTESAKQYAIQLYGLANEIQVGIVDDAQARAADQAFKKLINAGRWMAQENGNEKGAIELFKRAEELGGGRKLGFDAAQKANSLSARLYYQEGLQFASRAGAYLSITDDSKATEFRDLATKKFEKAKELDPKNMNYVSVDESARISSATKRRKDSERLFSDGRQAILSGEFDKAVQFFSLAKENDNILDLDPRRFVELLAGEEMIQRGKSLAAAGERLQAIESFDLAREKLRSSTVPDPFGRLNFDSAQLARYESVRLDVKESWSSNYESSLGTQAMNLAIDGKVADAIELLRSVQSFDPTLSFSATTWNNLCWWSCLNDREHAADYLVYGELAVQLAPEQANFRDTRGLARALTAGAEETKGIRDEETIKELRESAIKDFEAFVAWAWDRDDLRSQRQEWVDKLRDDVPIDQIFTDEEIEDLKSQ